MQANAENRGAISARRIPATSARSTPPERNDASIENNCVIWRNFSCCVPMAGYPNDGASLLTHHEKLAAEFRQKFARHRFVRRYQDYL